ncbi:MAG: hypothetical protein ABH950_03760 [Candidatus Altiarchaeota archaeon]
MIQLFEIIPSKELERKPGAPDTPKLEHMRETTRRLYNDRLTAGLKKLGIHLYGLPQLKKGYRENKWTIEQGEDLALTLKYDEKSGDVKIYKGVSEYSDEKEKNRLYPYLQFKGKVKGERLVVYALESRDSFRSELDRELHKQKKTRLKVQRKNRGRQKKADLKLFTTDKGPNAVVRGKKKTRKEKYEEKDITKPSYVSSLGSVSIDMAESLTKIMRKSGIDWDGDFEGDNIKYLEDGESQKWTATTSSGGTWIFRYDKGENNLKIFRGEETDRNSVLKGDKIHAIPDLGDKRTRTKNPTQINFYITTRRGRKLKKTGMGLGFTEMRTQAAEIEMAISGKRIKEEDKVQMRKDAKVLRRRQHDQMLVILYEVLASKDTHFPNLQKSEYKHSQKEAREIFDKAKETVHKIYKPDSHELEMLFPQTGEYSNLERDARKLMKAKRQDRLSAEGSVNLRGIERRMAKVRASFLATPIGVALLNQCKAETNKKIGEMYQRKGELDSKDFISTGKLERELPLSMMDLAEFHGEGGEIPRMRSRHDLIIDALGLAMGEHVRQLEGFYTESKGDVKVQANWDKQFGKKD